MYYLMLFAAVAGIAANFSLGKAYQLRVPPSPSAVMYKAALTALLSALMFWLMSGCEVRFSGYTLLFSAVAALLGTLSVAVCFFGYASGSIAVFTMFQMTGGMLLPFIYGVLCGNEISVWRIAGMILLLVSIALPFIVSGRSAARPTPGFLFLSLAVFFLNGAFSITSYIYSNSPSSTGAFPFLVLKSLLSAALTLPLLLIFAGKRGHSAPAPQRSRYVLPLLLVLMTAADGLSYWLQLVGAAHLPAVALYPIVTGGTVAATALAGRLFFREKIGVPGIAAVLIAFAATFLFMF